MSPSPKLLLQLPMPMPMPMPMLALALGLLPEPLRVLPLVWVVQFLLLVVLVLLLLLVVLQSHRVHRTAHRPVRWPFRGQPPALRAFEGMWTRPHYSTSTP
jgi:Mn2+/Fe2+ NRAMP family transporter